MEVTEVFDIEERRLEREQAFIYVFEKSFQEELDVSDLALMNIMCDTTVTAEYSIALAEKTLAEVENIDGIIKKYLKGWSIYRLAKTTLSILRIAIAEILYFDDIPAPVAINEAVELAKKYCGEKEPGFINGLLGTFVRAEIEND